MVFIHPEHALRILIDIRLYHGMYSNAAANLHPPHSPISRSLIPFPDDTTIVHQLQAEVRGPFAMAHDDLQIFEHIHR